MVKQVKWESIIALPVKNPKEKLIFSRSDLDWSLVQGKHMDSLDRIAKIPSARVEDFIKGEEMNPNSPCAFTRVQSKRPGSRPTASLVYEV